MAKTSVRTALQAYFLCARKYLIIYSQFKNHLHNYVYHTTQCSSSLYINIHIYIIICLSHMYLILQKYKIWFTQIAQ